MSLLPLTHSAPSRVNAAVQNMGIVNRSAEEFMPGLQYIGDAICIRRPWPVW